MKQVTINIPDNKYHFFIELIKSLDFTKVVDSDKNISPEQQQFVSDIKQSLDEVVMHQQGKIKLQKAREFLNEL